MAIAYGFTDGVNFPPMEKNVRLGYVGDGSNYHVRKWLPALVDAGIEVVLFTFDVPEEPLRGVKVVELKRNDSRSYVDYVRPSARQQLSAQLVEERCNVLMGSYATHYGWLAARTRFSPFVMQTWTGDLTVYPFKGIKRFVFGPIVRYGLARADLITTDGRALLAEGKRLFPEFAHKMVATRWGISVGATTSTETFRRLIGKDLPSGVTVLVAPRGLQHWYQPELAIESVLTAVERESGLHAVVLTLGHDRDPNMDALLRSLGHHPRATILDRFLGADEMATLWSAADLVLSIPYNDGISESVLEAMHSGALPILSDIPSNRSLVDEGVEAWLVDSDVDSVVGAILEATNVDADRAEAMRERNRSWVKANATVEGTANELAAALSTLVAATAPKDPGQL